MKKKLIEKKNNEMIDFTANIFTALKQKKFVATFINAYNHPWCLSHLL